MTGMAKTPKTGILLYFSWKGGLWVTNWDIHRERLEIRVYFNKLGRIT